MTDNVTSLFPSPHPVSIDDLQQIAQDLSQALGMKVEATMAGDSVTVAITAPDLERLDALCRVLQAVPPG